MSMNSEYTDKIDNVYGDSPPRFDNVSFSDSNVMEESGGGEVLDEDQKAESLNEDEELSSNSQPEVNYEEGYVGEDDDDNEDDYKINTDDLSQLFSFIETFKPSDYDLETQLKVFIPDFIPAIGDIDAFIKIPRLDNKVDSLGLVVLDEPSVEMQSDPVVLDLQLRANSKSLNTGYQTVYSIDGKIEKHLDDWIKKIDTLHTSKQPTAVEYSRCVPDIDSLMQAWPTEIEELQQTITLPSCNLDLPLRQFVRIVSVILDIPTEIPTGNDSNKNGKNVNLIESLHIIFTLYLEFQNSTHFKKVTSDYLALAAE